MLQCASYAPEMSSHNGLRSHVINALVTDDTIQLILRLLHHAIANLSLPQLGYAEVLKPAPLLDNPRQTTNVFDGLKLKLNHGTRLELGGTIFHRHGIIGRGTCVA